MAKKKRRKHNYVTLIWEELPEDVKIFVIPREDIEKEDLLTLRTCHNNYLGSVSADTSRATKEEVDVALVRLLNMLTDPEAEWISDKYKADQAEQLDASLEELEEILGKWHKHLLDRNGPRTLPRSKMYRSGYCS
jgi:hypothetical protein